VCIDFLIVSLFSYVVRSFVMSLCISVVMYHMLFRSLFNTVVIFFIYFVMSLFLYYGSSVIYFLLY